MITKYYQYYFSKDKPLINRLKDLVGFVPRDIKLFKMVFYHKSSNGRNFSNNRNQSNSSVGNNERLEYLGDAMLSMVVAEYLYKKYPTKTEGFLTKMRSKIVKRTTLNFVGGEMGLDIFLKEFNDTNISQSMLGNALEALVGAIYLELGYEKTKKFIVERILRSHLDIHTLETFDDNYKSQLLEWCQKRGRDIGYKTISKYKTDKRDKFKVAVLVDGQRIATADEYNKKMAEQLASKKALKSLNALQKPKLEDE